MSLANAVLFGGILAAEPKWREPEEGTKDKLFVSLFLIQNNGIWPKTMVTVTCNGKVAEYVRRVVRPQIGDALSIDGYLGNPTGGGQKRSKAKKKETDPFAIVVRAKSVFFTYSGKLREESMFDDTRELAIAERRTNPAEKEDLV